MRFRFIKVGEAKDYILAAFLLLLSLSVGLSRNEGGLNSLRQVSVTLVSALQTPLSSIRIYRQALNTNTYLQRQNILLQDELSRLRSIEQENRQLREMLQFSEDSDLTLKPVSIIGKELNGINSSLTINAGSYGQVEEGMPLITSDGLLGKVILTNKNFAQVMPYFNSLFRVSARIQENQAVGIVSWTGDNITELVMDFVPQTIPVDSGFVVETSGASNQFPQGIPIGYVTRTEAEAGKETQRIFLKPFTSLFDVSQGFVVLHSQDTSLVNLQQKYDEIFE